MKSKIAITFIVLFSIIGQLNGQGIVNNVGNSNESNEAPRFSFKVGYNLSDVVVSPEPMNVVTSKNGFHIGVVAKDINFGKVGFQPELLYSMQGFNVSKLGNVGLHYIALPLLLKLNMGSNVSVLVGPQVSYLANTKVGFGNDLFSMSINGLFQKWDASAVGGLEYKLNEKVSLGGRYVMGLNNVNKNFDLTSTKSLNDYFTLKNSNAQFYLTLSL